MLVTSRADFEMLKQMCENSELIAFDTETTWTGLYTEKGLLGVSISVPKKVGASSLPATSGTVLTAENLSAKYDSWYFPVGHLPVWDVDPNNQPVEWLKELPWDDKSKKWVAHNAKFDIEVMKREAGVEPKGLVYDTQVMAHAINENHRSYELDYLGNIFFRIRKEDIQKVRKDFEKRGLTWSHIPPHIMGSYAERDTELTYELLRLLYPRWRQLRPDLRASTLLYVRTLGRMVSNGLLVDAEALTRHSEAARARLEAIKDELGHVPTDAWTRAQLYDKRGLPVLELTQAGASSVSKDTLTKLQAMNTQDEDLVHFMDLVMEYRTTQKARSTWYDGWREYIGEDGRIHPGFKQHGTETSRLSCAKPSTHQIPRDGDKYAVKECILAPEGFAYVEFDYNAVELRIASQLAFTHTGDRRMFSLLVEGQDAHHATAELIGSYDYFPGKPKEGRQVGKRKNFLNIYRGGALRLRVALWGDARMDIPVTTCKEWQDVWHGHYWGFRAINEKAQRVSHKRRYAQTWNGRRRHFFYDPDNDQPFKDTFNFMCQGGGGQCLIVASNRIMWDPQVTAQMVNCVHDSLAFYIPLDSYDEQVELITKHMRAVPEEAFPGMLFPVEASKLK